MTVTTSSLKAKIPSDGKIWDGRKEAKPHQIKLLYRILELLTTNDVIGINAPPGWGKSYIARSLQIALGYTDIITANNNLINQYKRDYPELNVVKGKDHYATSQEYETAKRIARSSAPSIFNPLSALFTCPRDERQTKYTIVDEAHTLGEMLRTAATNTFNTSKAGIPKRCTSEFELARWAKQRFHELNNRLLYEQPTKDQIRELEKVGAVYYSVVGHEQDSIFNLSRSKAVARGRRYETMSVQAVDYPIGLIDQVIGSEKTILMSGTLTKYETEKLACGRPYVHISLPYLAPPAQRPVYVRSFDREDRKDIPKVCAEIRRLYEEKGRPATVVHVTYGDVHEYVREMADLQPIWNTPRNKEQTEADFRSSGGIWLAAGCSEGIDLGDDACRLIIIPRLHFPNKGDIYVQKRLGRPDGRKWYGIKTLETTIQQLGRGVRHSEDYCEHYVFDPYFPQLWEEYKHEFQELNIIWGQ